jgi:hypothetical protein
MCLLRICGLFLFVVPLAAINQSISQDYQRQITELEEHAKAADIKLRAMQFQMSDSLASLAAREAEVVSLKATLKGQKDDRGPHEVSQPVNSQADEKEALAQQLAEARQDISGLQRQLDEAVAARDALLQQQRVTASSEASMAMKATPSVQSESPTHAAAAATDDKNTKSNDAEMEALTRQNESLLMQLGAMRTAHREGADANMAVSKQWQKERDRSEKFLDELVGLRAQLKQSQEDTQALQLKQAHASADTHAADQAETLRLTTQVQDLQTQLEDVRRELASKQQSADATHTSSKAHEAHLESLNNQLRYDFMCLSHRLQEREQQVDEWQVRGHASLNERERERDHDYRLCVCVCVCEADMFAHMLKPLM